MLLQRLKEYATTDQDMQAKAQLYARKPVRYIIYLDMSGQVTVPHPGDTADPKSQSSKRGQPRLVPFIQRSFGIKPLLFADNAEQTLGVSRSEEAEEAKVAARHQAYRELVKRCWEGTQEPSVHAVHTFLENNPQQQLDLAETFDARALITFCVEGVFPVDLPSVQRFWADEHDPAARNAVVMQCILCGHERPILDRMQNKIQGIPEGRPSGMALISANAPAFLSYGLKDSRVAPTCANCAEQFTDALNNLLKDKQHHVRIDTTVCVFWSEKVGAIDLYSSFLNEPDDMEVQRLLESLYAGKFNPDVDATKFYATTLTATGGRVVVRDWIDTTVGQVKQRLAQWFLRQRIVDAYGHPPRPMGLYALVGAMGRKVKDVPKPIIHTLLRSAFAGTPLPMSLLSQVHRRCRAEQDVTRARAALIRLVFCSQNILQEDMMVELDLDNPNVTYRCGRLLAVLGDIQREAIGKALIVERFYGTASSAPASVFPRMLRGAWPHLAKLERDRVGVAIALEQRIEEITTGIPVFPRILSLQEQGLFALGFYHQRAASRHTAKQRKQERELADAQQHVLTDDDTAME